MNKSPYEERPCLYNKERLLSYIGITEGFAGVDIDVFIGGGGGGDAMKEKKMGVSMFTFIGMINLTMVFNSANI